MDRTTVEKARRFNSVSSTRPNPTVTIALRGLFSYRPTPFAGVWFAVEGGKLVIAAPDA